MQSSTHGVVECLLVQCDQGTVAVAIIFGIMFACSLRFVGIVLTVIRAYAPEQLPDFQIPVWRVWLGTLTHSFLAPAAILWNLLWGDVIWSGIRYRVKAGRVVKVSHHEQGWRSPHT